MRRKSVRLTRYIRPPTLITTALCSTLLLTMPTLTKAGAGNFKNGAHNFCVSVRFNATAAQLATIRTAFQNGSQVLADATDNQHKFGTVTLVNNSGASRSSEYWVNAGAGRAYATQGLYGTRGEHVMMYFDSNFQQSNGADGDAYTVAHEHAHHSYGVLDEYSGPSGGAECATPPDTAILSYSLMDNYFTRGGRASAAGYTLNEFCVNANHDPDKDTWQQHVHKQSAWSTISGHATRSATAPTGLPADVPPAAHTVSFVDGLGGLRVMLLLDRSGSMLSESRMVFAKLGAKLFTNFVSAGDSLGVSSFSTSASVNFPLTMLTGGGELAGARSAIDTLFASGGTNITSGLQASLSQITAQATPSCNQIIVLLSDGDHNSGPAPAGLIPSLQDAGITVLSVGLGQGISTSGQATLQTIATSTGGRFFRVSSAFDLVSLFMRLVMESIGNGLLTRAPINLGSGESTQAPVLIEQGSTSAVFAVTFANSADDFSLSLKTPSGTTITSADAVNNAQIEFFTEPNALTFRIANPAAGTWNLVVSTGSVSNGTAEVLAFSENDGVDLAAMIEKDQLVFPEVAVLHATPRFAGEAVVGSTVTGTASRPDGTKIPFTLFDDGNESHGDGLPNDGIYSARFNNYSGDGTYTFDIHVENVSGVSFAGENLFPNIAANTKPVPAFNRSTSVTAILTQVPLLCDLDQDGDVDRADLSVLLADRNARVEDSSCGVSCDIDGNGVIDMLDARRCTALCTLSGCTSP